MLRDNIEMLESMRMDECSMPTPQLKRMVAQAVKLAAEIKSVSEHLDALTAEYNALTTKQLVDEMGNAGMEEFTTTDGSKIAIKDFMSGSLPKSPVENKRALDWLDKNGGGDLAKCTFIFALDKGDDKARKILTMTARKHNIACDESIKVHPQSLYAFVRERLERGEKTPIETLGLYLGKVAKISLPAKGVKLGRAKPRKQKG